MTLLARSYSGAYDGGVLPLYNLLEYTKVHNVTQYAIGIDANSGSRVPLFRSTTAEGFFVPQQRTSA